MAKRTIATQEAEMAALSNMTPQQTESQPNPAEAMVKSLGKIPSANNIPTYTRDERLDKLQYIEVNRKIMNYAGSFYPADWVFKCRAALGAEVAHFSTINSQDIFSTSEGMNDLIKSCLRITNAAGENISFMNLYEFDRLWFVMFIRDLTMVNAENKIIYEVNCEHCQEPNKITFSYDNMCTTPISETADKYWDEDACAFMLRTKNYGILKVQPSTLRRAQIFSDWIVDIRRNNKKQPDVLFMKLYWMLVNSDNDLSSNAIDNAYKQFVAITQDTKKLSLYLKLSTELALGITDKLVYRCSSCEREAHGDITFPGGFENLLLDTTALEELL